MADTDSRKSSTKQGDIIQAAEQLFLHKGIRSVTVEEIAREAKVSKRTYYKYFSDKQALVEHILLVQCNAIVEMLGRLIEKGERGQLTQTNFLKMFDINEYDRVFQTAFTDELLDDYAEMLQRFQLQWSGIVIPLFRRLVQLAQEAGILRKDMDLDFFIDYMQVMRRALLAQYPLSGMDLKEFSDKFYDLYLYGVVAQKDK